MCRFAGPQQRCWERSNECKLEFIRPIGRLQRADKHFEGEPLIGYAGVAPGNGQQVSQIASLPLSNVLPGFARVEF